LVRLVVITVAFLEKLTVSEGVTADKLAQMDKAYGLTHSRNSEVRFRWYTLAIKHGYDTVYLNVVSFLKEQGRMKFVRPLFRDLFRAQGVAKQIALDTFAQHREAYHPIGTGNSLQHDDDATLDSLPFLSVFSPPVCLCVLLHTASKMIAKDLGLVA
jgi:hypothetical protein